MFTPHCKALKELDPMWLAVIQVPSGMQQLRLRGRDWNVLARPC